VPGHHTWTEPKSEQPHARPLRILVVDDDRDTVVSLVAVLREEQFDVRGAFSGRTALTELTEFDADVVIVDIAMPEMSGWEVARDIRSLLDNRITLIAVTGAYVKKPDELLSRVAGFNFFYTKPVDPRALVRVLRSFNPRRRSRNV
jgi:CheY-like chemotaxis protein